jgi:excisionase family DNA binding protein
MESEVLTVVEVAKLMRICRETVYRLAARGELPGRKIGRVWRFRQKDVADYLSVGAVRNADGPSEDS